MCTVTFHPVSKTEYILTANRDEHVKRDAVFPMQYKIHNTNVMFPRDKTANGTWIAATPKITLCLLNGAFKKHIRENSYRMRRGIMLLDFFKFKNANKFISQYDFNGIEPFTLLVIDAAKKISLNEIRWDGTKKYFAKKNPSKNHIWSSATLYPEKIIREREKWFRKFLGDNPALDQDKILEFHHFAGKGDKKYNLVMQRSRALKTVSITSILKTNDSSNIIYEDILRGIKYQRRIY